MSDDPEIVAAARQEARAAAEDEHRRLLYVALTRAEERLYISGFFHAREPQAVAWNKMIHASLGDGFEDVPAFWDKSETILRRVSEGAQAPSPAKDGEASPHAPVQLPDFLLRPAPHEESPAPPLKPATALAAADGESRDLHAGLNRSALERGRLIHMLLQYLPQLSPNARRKAAQAFLAARADHLKFIHGALIDEALGVLDMDGLAELFGPAARTEVAVVGKITSPNGAVRDVSGQVDRIVETAKDVIVADYKTGAVPSEGAIPASYLTQMSLYRATLAPLWPEKKLRMILIFTAGPKVIELAPEVLDQALAMVA